MESIIKKCQWVDNLIGSNLPGLSVLKQQKRILRVKSTNVNRALSEIL